jgi:hypothetical protein
MYSVDCLMCVIVMLVFLICRDEKSTGDILHIVNIFMLCIC